MYGSFYSVIKKYEAGGLLKGVQVARGAPSMNHIFFANDSYILCQENIMEADYVVNY